MYFFKKIFNKFQFKYFCEVVLCQLIKKMKALKKKSNLHAAPLILAYRDKIKNIIYKNSLHYKDKKTTIKNFYFNWKKFQTNKLESYKLNKNVFTNI